MCGQRHAPGETRYPLYYQLIIRVKGKVHPRTDHEGPDGEESYNSTLHLTSALDAVGSQRHAPGETMYPLYYQLLIRVKGKVHPRTDNEGPDGEERYNSTLHLTSALDAVGGQRHATAALSPVKAWCPFYRRLGGTKSRSGRVRKMYPQLGFDPRTIQPLASHYTDWAIQDHYTLHSLEQIIIIIIIIIITYSFLRKVRSLFRSEFSRQRDFMLALHKRGKNPEKWCLYRIRPSFLICSPVQSAPRNHKFNGPTLG